MEKDVLVEINNKVATIILNRPQKGNSITNEMGNEIIKYLDNFEKDINIRYFFF
jgi:enoyl-CoA hydratase/carnithine racemase